MFDNLSISQQAIYDSFAHVDKVLELALRDVRLWTAPNRRLLTEQALMRLQDDNCDRGARALFSADVGRGITTYGAIRQAFAQALAEAADHLY